MADRFDVLLEGLKRERALPETSRDTNASDAVLDAAIRDVSRAVGLLRDGRHTDALGALARVTYHVIDSWSWASPLSEELVKCERDLRWLVDRQYMREWAGDAVRPAGRRARSPFEPTYDGLFVEPPRKALTLSRAVLRIVGVVLVVVVAAVVVTVLYARGSLAVAGPYLAPILAMAIMVVPLWWWAGQAERRRRTIIRELRGLPHLIREELAVPLAMRTSQASDESLSLALAGAEKALRRFTLGLEADGVAELDQLCETSAGWAPRARLSTKVARLGRAGRRLSRTVRRLDHLARVRQRQGRPEDPGSVGRWDRWLIRFPVYSLFVWMGAYGMHQWDWVSMSGTFAAAGVGVLAVALWQLRQQTRGRRPQ